MSHVAHVRSARTQDAPTRFPLNFRTVTQDDKGNVAYVARVLVSRGIHALVSQDARVCYVSASDTQERNRVRSLLAYCALRRYVHLVVTRSSDASLCVAERDA